MKRINVETGELQALIAVAQTGSFRGAAQELFLSQPALSRRIDKLELALGTQLVQRTTRRVSLTEAGHQFLSHARAAVEQLELAVAGASYRESLRTGSVTVACVPSVANHVMPGVLKTFSARFPNIRVRLLDESAQQVLDSVINGMADFGINFIGTQEAEVEFKAVQVEQYLLAVPRGHPFAARNSIQWEELADEKLISVSQSSGNRMLIDNALARLRRRPVIFYEANHIAGALAMAAAGLGVAAIPGLALSSDSYPALTGVPLAKPTIRRTLGMIKRKDAALQSFTQVLYRMTERSLAGLRRPKARD
jgi:DNA-binding transcriptional LysR family regulator